MTNRLQAVNPDIAEARHANAATLAHALQDARARTLATFHETRRWLPSLEVAYDSGLNPPLWELGHVGWFQEYWIARNPLLEAGSRADPGIARRPGIRVGSDALYDSSRVPHRTRWSLPLPTVSATLDDLSGQLDGTLKALSRVGSDDDSLYFFRLALFHEDMHGEAALYMAQSLGLAIGEWAGAMEASSLQPRRQLAVEGGTRRIGSPSGGFAFDNELPSHAVDMPGFTIDSTAVSWADFLPFIEDNGYCRQSLWTDAGRRWVEANDVRHPRYLVREDGEWRTQRFGRIDDLRLDMPACHLTQHEARAWCTWAGRRLPTELEWETAADVAVGEFAFGQVWEWTSSCFAPYDGFVAHPYREYSAPWFDGRPVLRGASWATSRRMKSSRYRNFFTAERSDIFAGFRTCSPR